MSAEIDRRSFIKLGSTTVAGAAILAACANNPETEGPSASTQVPGLAEITTTTVVTMTETDLLLLRTGGSLERVLTAVYDAAIASGVVTTSNYADALNLFMRHHEDHLSYYDAETLRGGGVVYSEPNPEIFSAIEARVNSLTTELAAITLLAEVEDAVAASYRLWSPMADEVKVRQDVMGVGGVESRHLAFWLRALGRDPAPTALATTTNALAPGAGIEG